MDFKYLDALLRVLAPLVDESPLLLAVIGLIALAIILSAVAKLVESALKFVEMVMASIRHGVEGLKGNRAKRRFIQRRSQFLKVLAADLASIGKAESWNDQHYTDLEADVQIDGGYYASPIARLVRRKTSGRRRAESLMKAIDGSSEKSLLLTGDPGAGKSVALRHLATQLIERSLNSRDDGAAVPLYVNLREMNIDASEVDVNAIKAFVIDNVRRGDADTADYLKENWDEFKQRGIWFFLFDSFDEIPAVLHAAANDPAVARYGRAIQQFMDGIGGCRGILASREFKSPALHWPKIRILQLDESRQLELIDRTFLNEDKKAVARTAVSLSQSATYRNPLFLTLLCKYVGKTSSAPSNEHELLIDHVKNLAKRDPEYLASRWGITPEYVLNAAASLALLLGDASNLGLSPTVDEILAAARGRGFSFGEDELIKVIEALTYVKIGRTDVQSSDLSIRRFAFSHRRYQEGLYAIWLSDNLSDVDVAALVTDARRREYLVALLQIGDPQAIEVAVSAGADFLRDAEGKLRFRHRKFLGEELHTYAWGDDQIAHVLSVFMEAKRYWPDGPWGALQAPAERLLASIWRHGDFYDILKVVEYCGVGSADSLSSRLNFSIDSGVDRIEEAAVDSCKFLLNPDEGFAGWVRQHVAARIVTASRTFERLQWEAVAAQLPVGYRMQPVLDRARSLADENMAFQVPYVLFTSLAKRVSESMRRDSLVRPASSHRRLRTVLRLGLLHALYLVLIAGFLLYQAGTDPKFNGAPSWLILGMALILVVVATSYAVKVSCLDEPERLTIAIVARRLSKVRVRRRNFAVFVFTALLLVAPGVVLKILSAMFGWFPSVKSVDLVLAGSMAFTMSLGGCVVIFERVGASNQYGVARHSLDLHGSFQKAMSKAETFGQVVALSRVAAKRSCELEDIRAAISYMTAVLEVVSSGREQNEPKWLRNADRSGVRSVLSNLLRTMDRVERSGKHGSEKNF